jgi:hypothetical protein
MDFGHSNTTQEIFYNSIIYFCVLRNSKIKESGPKAIKKKFLENQKFYNQYWLLIFILTIVLR